MENEKEMRRRTNQRREVRGIRKGERKEKKTKEEKKTEGREMDRERKKGEERKNGDFSGVPKFRRSNLDGLRVKVDPRIESYAWVPKSGSFVKLQEVKNFPIWIISSLKAIYWHGCSSGV